MTKVEFTDEARAILKAAVDGDGAIMFTRTMGRPGVHIDAGEQEMVPNNADNRTVQAWIGGLEDLQALGYIRGVGHQGECFEVTREGYRAVDEEGERDFARGWEEGGDDGP